MEEGWEGILSRGRYRKEKVLTSCMDQKTTSFDNTWIIYRILMGGKTGKAVKVPKSKVKQFAVKLPGPFSKVNVTYWQ